MIHVAVHCLRGVLRLGQYTMLGVRLSVELLIGALTFRLEFRRFTARLFDSRALGRHDTNIALVASFFFELGSGADALSRLWHDDSVLVDAKAQVFCILRVLVNRGQGLLLLLILDF